MPADALGIFVKSPQAGLVKTRLAESIGAARAAALYRVMGRKIVEACRDPNSHTTTIWFAPADGEHSVDAWLGTGAVDAHRAQPEGGLDVRLTVAFAHHFAAGARRVLVIGSDCPGVDRGLLRQAFGALDQHDLVIGPAQDGGYYLLGLTAPAPELFRHVIWSTDLVFRQTMLNAARLGMSASVLPELRDVDTEADARALDLLSAVGEAPS